MASLGLTGVAVAKGLGGVCWPELGKYLSLLCSKLESKEGAASFVGMCRHICPLSTLGHWGKSVLGDPIVIILHIACRLLFPHGSLSDSRDALCKPPKWFSTWFFTQFSVWFYISFFTCFSIQFFSSSSEPHLTWFKEKDSVWLLTGREGVG